MDVRPQAYMQKNLQTIQMQNWKVTVQVCPKLMRLLRYSLSGFNIEIKAVEIQLGAITKPLFRTPHSSFVPERLLRRLILAREQGSGDNTIYQIENVSRVSIELCR